MSVWRHLVAGLRALFRRADTDRDVADEVQHYLDEAAAEHRARGLSRREARRAVRLELGGQTNAVEQVRGYGWENAVEALFTDLRYSGRRLVAEPVFTVVTVFTIAVGIGATTAIFSAVNTILLQPLPYPDADRVVSVQDVGADGAPLAETFGTHREIVDRSRSFSQLAVLKPWQPTLSGTETPERLDGQRVSASYFRVLGVAPELGRHFRDIDDRIDGPAEVILSDALWRRHFGSDPDILERPIRLDGRTFAVIGVMPPSFENVPSPEAGLWATLQYDMTQGRAWGHHLHSIGRLRAGIGVDAAMRELNDIAGAPIAEFPRPEWASLQQGLLVSPLQDEVTGDIRPALLAILGGAVLVLAIAGVNVTNLLLARSARRRGEFAMRTALGAGRGRLIRQLLTESLVLAAAGGVAGVAVALLGVRALVALSPPNLPRLDAIAVDGAVFAVGLGLTTLVGVVFGLIPALQAAGSDPCDAMRGSSTRTTGGHSGTRSALVVAEVALAVVLLVSSGLLLRSLQQLFDVEVGFDPRGLQTLQVQVSGDRYDDETTERFFTEAIEAIRSVPGVTAAGFTSQLPLSGDENLYGVRFDAEIGDGQEDGRGTFRYTVSPGYIEAMGTPLRRGRLFNQYDQDGALRVAIISESAARKRLPGLDPIGQHLRVGPADLPGYEIIGVVADVRQVSLALSDAEAVYIPAAQWHFTDAARSLVVRAGEGSDASLMAAIREAIWSVDKERPIVRVATMDDLLTASVAQRRFALILFEAFALASLILAAAGIYGVLAGSVTERTRELGVRAALGASRQTILTLVLRQGLSLTARGAAIGAAAALAATSALAAMLFGVSRLDPVTYLGVIALLASVATLACALPAWRAARIDPAKVLRAE